MKRTPLNPGTGFKPRTVPLRRTTGLTACPAPRRNAPRKGRATGTASGKPKPPPEFTARVRRLVRKRAGCGDIFGAQAECCGVHLGEKAGEFQHRAARGSGGCRDAVINGPSNCLLMCRACHRLAEDRDRHMRDDATGFWIRHGTTAAFDPRFVSVMLHAHGEGRGGTVLWLAEDGIGADGDGYLRQRPTLGRAA